MSPNGCIVRYSHGPLAIGQSESLSDGSSWFNLGAVFVDREPTNQSIVSGKRELFNREQRSTLEYTCKNIMLALTAFRASLFFPTDSITILSLVRKPFQKGGIDTAREMKPG